MDGKMAERRTPITVTAQSTTADQQELKIQPEICAICGKSIDRRTEGFYEKATFSGGVFGTEITHPACYVRKHHHK
jgi:hypothetical protein